MSYFKNFLEYLIKFFYTNTGYFILLIILVIETLFIYALLLKLKKPVRDLKIYNFNLNTIFLNIYVIIFFIAILVLRYIRWGYTFDLFILYFNITFLYQKAPLIVFLNILFAFILIFLLLLIIKIFLNKEILKRHLYYINYSYIEALKIKNSTLNQNEEPLYYKLCKKIEQKYNYINVTNKLVHYSVISFYCNLTKKMNYPPKLKYYSKKILLYLPKSIIIILLLIDCIYNNYQFHLIFYYLPFYFIFYIWHTIGSFLVQTNEQLNKIIYERYYEEYNIKYIGTTDDEDSFIFKYIERGCLCFSFALLEKNSTNKAEQIEHILDVPCLIIYNRRFMRVDNTNVFRNYSTDEEVLEETLKETPIY